MAYQMKGLPPWVYQHSRRDLRTDFVDVPEGWNPWVDESAALDLLERVERAGVETKVAQCGRTHYTDMSATMRRAVDLYKLARNAGDRKEQLWRCRIGRTSGWAVAPSLSEAICRAFLGSTETKDLRGRL